MKYRVQMSIEIDARNDQEAYEAALKLKGLLATPVVKMAVQSEGIQLSGNGRPIVHQPQRTF